MAKKNLKNALRAHEAKKLQADKLKAVEEAAKRKAISIRTGKQPSSKKKSSQAARSHVRPFSQEDTILLVGEGNFSFAHSLLLPPHTHNPDLILATALDSEEECYDKYPDAKEHVESIRKIAKRSSIIVFGVDAGNLDGCKALTPSTGAKGANDSSIARWSKVVFNFPHLGAGHKDEARNVLSNQLMLVRFLVSVAPFLTTGTVPSYASSGIDSNDKNKKKKKRREEDDDDGEGQEPELDRDMTALEEIDVSKSGFTVPSYAGSILVTLRNCKPYTLWDLPLLAKKLPSVYNAIASSAPSSKGVKGPSAAQVARLLSIGQGKSYRVWRSFQFHPDHWPVYTHRRTIGWKQERSTSENEDITRHQDGEKNENRTWELSLAG
ncbi:hypothetical protein CBS101457_006162 [Exobasidium rhododendri]|nr:hypothetical protein CBS101457_006162 [Exobasidium rhododendri]